MVSELDLRIDYVVHNLQYEVIPYSLPYPMKRIHVCAWLGSMELIQNM